MINNGLNKSLKDKCNSLETQNTSGAVQITNLTLITVPQLRISNNVEAATLFQQPQLLKLPSQLSITLPHQFHCHLNRLYPALAKTPLGVTMVAKVDGHPMSTNSLEIIPNKPKLITLTLI